LLDQRQRLANFAAVRQHGNQQVHAPMGRRAQDGAQLREEHRRVGQAPADGAQAERRVQLRVL
jgi:hypothetical protein